MKFKFIISILLLFLISSIYTKSFSFLNENNELEELEDLEEFDVDQVKMVDKVDKVEEDHNVGEIDEVGETNARLNYDNGKKAACSQMHCPAGYPCTNGQCLMKCGRVFCIPSTSCEKDLIGIKFCRPPRYK